MSMTLSTESTKNAANAQDFNLSLRDLLDLYARSQPTLADVAQLTPDGERFVLWHGTTEDAIPGILAHGLQEMRDRKYQAKLLFVDPDSPKDQIPAEIDPPGYVFASPDRLVAETFAMTRVEYLKAMPGSFVPRLSHAMPDLRKLANAPVILDAKPALIRLEIPKDYPLVAEVWNQSQVGLQAGVPAQYIHPVKVSNWQRVLNQIIEEDKRV